MKHLANRALAILMLLLTLTLSLALALPVSADAATGTPAHTTFETALDLTATAVSEHMEEKTEERWYSITVSSAGEAVIVIQSHMDTYDYTDIWYAQVFAADGVTELDDFAIRGGTSTKSYVLHSEGTETYYLRISGNPKDKIFEAGDYTVSVLVALDGTEVDYENAGGIEPVGKSGIVTVSESGTEFLRLGGTSFIKLHAEEAFVALYRNRAGAIVPLVFGRTPESVEFVLSSTGEVVRAMTTTYDGYYWSYSDGINAYTDEEISADGLPIFFSDKSKSQHDEKLRDDVIKQIEIAEYGVVGRFFIYYWYWVALAVIAVIVLVFSFIFKSERGEGWRDPIGELIGGMIGDEYK